MTSGLLLLATGTALLLSGPAAAAVYNCLPVEMQDKPDHFRVLCGQPSGFEGGYPKDGADRIQSFAVPKSDVDFAKRFVYVIQTALTAGMVVQFQYVSGDHSGTAFGCDANDCRKPWAVGLLAPASDVRIPYAAWPSGATESLAQGKWAFYGPFSISSYRKLVVSMTGTGNADLYIRKDDPPTETDFTCRPLLSTSNESCTIQGPADPAKERAATYFVGVRGAGATNQYKLSVSIQSK
jgi:hypothetical protein